MRQVGVAVIVGVAAALPWLNKFANNLLLPCLSATPGAADAAASAAAASLRNVSRRALDARRDQGQCACCVSNLCHCRLRCAPPHTSLDHPPYPLPPFTTLLRPLTPCCFYYIWVCTSASSLASAAAFPLLPLHLPLLLLLLFQLFLRFLCVLFLRVVWTTKKCYDDEEEKKLYILFEQMCKMLESRLRLLLVCVLLGSSPFPFSPLWATRPGR